MATNFSTQHSSYEWGENMGTLTIILVVLALVMVGVVYVADN
jgi:hypothetical protein